MSAIRPFIEDDIPQVARLHRRVWPGNLDGLDSFHDYFKHVFLENPASDGSLPSLVSREDDGRIVGFIGIVPRRLAIDVRHFQAAVSSQFIVDPACRHVGLVALRLAKAFLSGPQDLSIADEANDVSRRIWEGLGGTTALLHSLYWTRPLRPTRFALSFLRERPAFALLATAGKPLATLADSLVARVPGSPFRLSEPFVSTDDLCARTVLAYGSEFCGAQSLRVEYDHPTLEWLLEQAARRNGGRLLKAAIRNGPRILGWYIGTIDAESIAHVAQLAATPASIDEVLDHLFYRAWQQGALAVTGRLDPRFIQALSDKYCVFHRRGPWVLVKAKEPELLRSFEAGHAWFSPLDGEWSLRFQSSVTNHESPATSRQTPSQQPSSLIRRML